MWVERAAAFGLGIAFTLFTLAMCANVEAATLKGNSEACVVLADVAESYAAARDSGATWEAAKPVIETDIAAALDAAATSIIKDKDDAEYAMQNAKKVWDEYAGLHPREVAMRVYVDCMKK